MDFSEFILVSSGIFIKPFQTLQKIYEQFLTETRLKIVLNCFLVSMIGNMSLIISNMISSKSGIYSSVPFLTFHIFFSLLIYYILNFILISLYFLMTSIIINKKNTGYNTIENTGNGSDLQTTVLQPLETWSIFQLINFPGTN